MSSLGHASTFDERALQSYLSKVSVVVGKCQITTSVTSDMTSNINFYVIQEGSYTVYIEGKADSLSVNASEPAPMPEPGNVALLGLGLLVMAARVSKRQSMEVGT